MATIKPIVNRSKSHTSKKIQQIASQLWDAVSPKKSVLKITANGNVVAYILSENEFNYIDSEYKGNFGLAFRNREFEDAYSYLIDNDLTAEETVNDILDDYM